MVKALYRGKGNVKQTTFHLLPLDEKRRQLWMKVIEDRSGLRSLRKDCYLQRAVVCGKHFSEYSFQNDVVSEKKLRPNAVPSIFLGSDCVSRSLLFL